MRTRTELECIVEDLKAANERAGGKREEIEAELTKVNKEISQKEKALAKLLPKWDQHRARETEERRKYVAASPTLLDNSVEIVTGWTKLEPI